jgi:hypothetical protein
MVDIILEIFRAIFVGIIVYVLVFKILINSQANITAGHLLFLVLH